MGGYRRSAGLSGLLILLAAVAPPAAAHGPAQSAGSEAPRCFSTIFSSGQSTDGRVVGSRDSGQAMFSTGDALYASGGGLVAGEEYLIYRIEGEASHPVTGESVGRVVTIVGSAAVFDRDGERAMIRIGNTCGEIEVGDRLVRGAGMELASAPLVPDFDPARLISAAPDDATVVYGSSESLYDAASETGRRDMTVRGAYAAGDVVTLDRGATNGWTPGAVVIFYETRSMVPGDPLSHDEAVIVGQGYVLRAEADTSAVSVTDSDRTIALGARARLLR